jgi:undecaprenyl phosphate N,N'-diacetylbacillosamine 1-phosphate transferase
MMPWYCSTLILLADLFLLTVVLYRQFFKRFWDIVLSGIAIIILSPTLLVLTILGRIKMKGNPFFVQARPGKKGKDGKEKIFNLIKFRSMTEEKDENGNYLPDDVRLTKYGKILRSTSLDELPELFNIFKGDMSIVGPRPLLVQYLPYYTETERHRHDIRPGLTGLAQVNGRNSIKWDIRLAYDVEYVNHITLFDDVKIIIQTIGKVLNHSDIAVDTCVIETFLDQERSGKIQPQ